MGRIVSIDYGLARLGVAISDETQLISSPLGMVKAQKSSAATIIALLNFLKNYTYEAIVIGLPLHMNGQVGFLADEVKHFVSLLEKEVTCPIILWDERLSSVQATRTLKEAGMSRKKRTKYIDTLSALILLQSYLDSKTLAHNP